MLALIWCPFPCRDSAETAARTMLEEKLVACANIGGAMESIYLYEGQIDQNTEIGVILKTSEIMLDQATARLETLHPYHTPAIIAWPANRATQATQDWIAAELKE